MSAVGGLELQSLPPTTSPWCKVSSDPYVGVIRLAQMQEGLEGLHAWRVNRCVIVDLMLLVWMLALSD